MDWPIMCSSLTLEREVRFEGYVRIATEIKPDILRLSNQK
jgi:hypothetical protein